MPGAHHASPSPLFDGRLHQLASSARGQLARWLSDVAEFLRRQPLDRYWPPHP
jgi:hypothetical protein